MKFAFNENVMSDAQELVDGLTTLTKMALNKKAKTHKLAKVYSVIEEDYQELNKTLKEKCLTYSAKQAQIDSVVNVLEKKGLAQAMSNPVFEWNFFSIQTQTLGVLLADTEVDAMAGLVDLHVVGLGDSMTFDIGTKALYDVEDAAYGTNVTRPRKHFKQPVTIAPRAKEASVQFDIVQMLVGNYDFGAEMAKIVLSIRTKQYQDAVTAVYTASPLAGTPFVVGTFNLTNYTELAERVGAVNNTGAFALGTRGAYRAAANGITTGFAVQDEILKSGMITDQWGVPTSIIEQSVDTSSAAFDFRVPNDKILVLGAGVNAPVQMVQEDYVSVVFEEGSKKNVMTRVYKYTFSYELSVISGNPYGIVTV